VHKANQNEVVSIQYMRGIAALSVAYFHTGVNSANLAWPSFIPREFGKAGVDVFFVISGFIMVLVTSSRETSPKQFLLRRIFRIVPLYWLFTLLVALTGLIYPAAMLNNAVDWTHIGLSMAFIPHVNPITGGVEPFFKLGWTLNNEMYFYVVFASLLLVRPISIRMALLSIWGIGGALFFLVFRPIQPMLQIYTNPIILEFVMGAFIGHFYVSGRLYTPRRSILLTLATVCAVFIVFIRVPDVFLFQTICRPLIYGVPAALLVWSLLTLDISGGLRTIGWLSLVGDASYSIYLSHTTTLTAFRIGAGALGLPVGNSWVGATLIATELACCIGAGIIIYLYVELPITNKLRAFSRASSAPSKRKSRWS